MSSSATKKILNLRFECIRNIGNSKWTELGDSNNVFKDCQRIRKEVFCVEQKIIHADEFDGFDFSSSHIIAYAGKEAVGVCRIRKALPFLKLERMAVLPAFRKCGYGNKIVEYALDMAQNDPEYKALNLVILIHAQSHLVDWYKGFGFTIFGYEFEECNILHYVMIHVPKFTKPFEFERLLINRPPREGYYQQSQPKLLEFNHPDQIIKIRSFLYQMERPYILPNYVCQSLDLFAYFPGNLLLVCFNKLLNRFISDGFSLNAYTRKLYQILITKLSNRLHAHYATVDDRWRYFYACSKIIEIMSLYREEKYKEALNACDDALMKGGDLDDGSLSRCAHDIQVNLIPPIPCVDVSKLKSRTIPNKLTGVTTESVTVLTQPSLDVFCNYVLNSRPCVIRGEVEKMPAFTKWSFEYFHQVLSHRKVPVEYGAYTADTFLQKVRTFHDFLKELVDSEEENSTVQAGYLAQHRLFEQVPSLDEDLPVPDYCLCDVKNEFDVEKNIFLGKGGSVSPMHHDPRHNFFCQIRGKKFFRLIAPEYSDCLYLHDDIMANNSSRIDLENPDLKEFPLFSEVIVEDVLLEPGDVLFVPKDYFHYVTAIDPSISVAMWFGEGEVLRGKIHDALLKGRGGELSHASPEPQDTEEPKKTKRESYV